MLDDAEATEAYGTNSKIRTSSGREIVKIPLSERKKKIKALTNEGDLHQLTAEILRKLGYTAVRIIHGPHEHGKDIVARMVVPTGGTEILAVVAKLGKISGAVGTKKNLSEIEEQVGLAFRIPYESHDSKQSEHVTRVLVVCNGEISNAAQQRIRAQPGTLRAVDFWDVDDLESKVTEFIPGFYFNTPSDLHDYCSLLRSRCSDVSEEFRRYGSSLAPGLEEVFVEPRLIRIDDLSRPLEKRKQNKLGRTRLAQIDQRIRIESSEIIQNPTSSMILMGEPGSGKTFVLRRACLALSESVMAGDESAAVPFLMKAPAVVTCRNDDLAEVLSTCCTAVQPLAVDRIREILENRRVAVFVDGLDEIPDENDRSLVLERLRSFDLQWPDCSLVATMRVLRFWRPRESSGFSQALILPLNSASMRELLLRILGRGKKRSRLLAGILQSGLTNALPQTPLVVTLLGILHEQQDLDEVPANISDLYDMFVQVFLGRWSSKEGEPGGALPAYQMEITILENLAWRMHEARSSSMREDEFRLTVASYLRERDLQRSAEDICGKLTSAFGLLELTDQSGCLVDAQDGTATDGDSVIWVAFRHISFQEYFAARFLNKNSGEAKSVFGQFNDPWWSNVLTYYAGIRRDVPDIIRAIIKSGLPENPLSCLFVALQLGHLLQAAYQTPADDRLRGCLHGTDLVQAFFVAFSKESESGRIGAKISEVQMAFALAVLFSMAYGSSYLSSSQRRALDRVLAECKPDGTERSRLAGVRAFCSAAALANRGDWSGLDDFVGSIGIQYPPLLQGVATLLEASAPSREPSRGSNDESLKAWDNVVRRVRKLASKKNRKIIAEYAGRAARTDGDSKLLDVPEDEAARKLPFNGDGV
jgi:hypothetical protein